ncbi:MAG: hypothetical protein FJW36_20390 [Acidobacteria bacterium]|nr:hypothetical protein [Acidobacteriota bacterium]
MIHAAAITPVHIIAGALCLASGYCALWAAKGAKLHSRSGLLFVGSMWVMSLTGAWIAFWNGPFTSLIAGLLTFYFVATALLTVRPHPNWIDPVGSVLATVVSMLAFAAGQKSWTAGKPEAIPMFSFGLMGRIAVAGDIRLLHAGSIDGRSRIARHLWRMCLGLLIAAASFFLGPQRRVPELIRIPTLLPIPVLIPLVVMLYWFLRLKFNNSGATTGAKPQHAQAAS